MDNKVGPDGPSNLEAPTHERASIPAIALREVLQSLLIRLGCDPDDDAVESAARTAELRMTRDHLEWPAAFVEACRALGISATSVRAPLTALLAGIAHERPAVFARDLGESLFLVIERRGQRVLVEGQADTEPAWISESDLAAWVGGAPDTDAVLVEPALENLLGGANGDGPPPEVPSAHHGPAPSSRLVSWAIGERGDLLTVLTYAIFVGLASLAMPIAVQVLVGIVTFGTVIQPLIVVAIMLAVGLAFAGTLRAASAWVVELLERRFFARVTTALADRLPRVDLNACGGPLGVSHVNRFFDVFIFQKASAALLAGALEVVLTAIVGMVVLAFYHPLLFAFDVVLLLIVGFVVIAPARRGTTTAIAESAAKHDLAVHLQAIATQPRLFQTGRADKLARAMTSNGARSWLKARASHFRVGFAQLAMLVGLEAFASASLLGIGGFLVIDHQLTLGQLVAAELIVTAVVAAVAKVGKHLASYYDLVAALDKVGHLIEIPQEPDRGVVVPGEGAFAIRASTASGAAHLSIDIAAGEHVVVRIDDPDQRESLTELLLGSRRKDLESFVVAGTDVRDLDLARFRRRVALIECGGLFNASLLENVRAGDSDISPSSALAALQRVGLEPLLERVPGRAGGSIAGSFGGHSREPRVGRVDAVRVSVARALCAAAGLVVVDGALDDLPNPARIELAQLITSLKATVVVLTGRSEVATLFAPNQVFQFENSDAVAAGGVK